VLFEDYLSRGCGRRPPDGTTQMYASILTPIGAGQGEKTRTWHERGGCAMIIDVSANETGNSDGGAQSPDVDGGILAALPRSRPQRASPRRAAARRRAGSQPPAAGGAQPIAATRTASGDNASTSGNSARKAPPRARGGQAKARATPAPGARPKAAAEQAAGAKPNVGAKPKVAAKHAVGAKPASRPKRSPSKSGADGTKPPTGRARKAQPTAKPTTRRAAQSKRAEPRAPKQGYEPEEEVELGNTVNPPSGVELVESVADIVGELANSGLAAGGRLLKDAFSLLRRP
jgi:hypothetical protein